MKYSIVSRVILLIGFCLYVFNFSISAQANCSYCKDATGKNICNLAPPAEYDKSRQEIELVLTKAITAADLKNAPIQSWVIVDISEVSVERPVYLIKQPERGDNRPIDDSEPFVNILLYLNQPLKPGHEYRIFQSKLTFKGCSSAQVLEASLSIKAPNPANSSSNNSTPAKPTENKNFFAKSSSKGRDDSNVYLSGNIEGARKEKVQFSADIKIDQPFGSYGFFEEIGPYFNLKASTSKKGDANSINFGAKLRHSFVIRRKANPETHQFIGKDNRLLTGVVLDFLPGFESDRRGKNLNTLLGSKLTFVPRTTGGSNPIYFQPFIGYEIGVNLKSPVPQAEKRGLSRALIGSSLYIDFPRQLKGVSFQADYTRRFLFNREIRFKEDKSGNLILLDVGKGPRDYLKTGFNFNFSDFAGVTLNYEYGQLPPNFQLVDSKFSFGLVYKFKSTYSNK